MRCLFYTNYQSGNSGLTNGIMSIEVGVILAHLTNRMLVLEGNAAPAANVVSYDGRVSNERPSRITDLLDIPVPWAEPHEVDLQELASLELTNLSLTDLVFYFPRTLDLSSSDAKSFARDRQHWLTVAGEHESVPVLRLSEDPLHPRTQRRRHNLSFYSYLFYLNDETRRSVYRLLGGMQAKRPFAGLAERVARDLGPFNAVHLRRGDFKVTYGVTTLDRKPAEAIEAMDQVFGRKEPLVILTDERDDPFFGEIKLAYPNHHFIDWHILDNHGAEFARLPQTDSLSLAFLSQLVAAEAKEFIGTMTSTFTGLIQRHRGNRGKNEAFRYLWNELPESGVEIERGRHAVSECIPLDRGQMIEQFSGPYTWNRVSQLLNPAWMREWPESFLLPEVVATGALKTKPASETPVVFAPALLAPASRPPAFAPASHTAIYVTFENLQVAVWCNDAALLKRLGKEMGADPSTSPRNVVANFEIVSAGSQFSIGQRGQPERTMCDKAQLPTVIKQEIGTVLIRARHKYAWLEAAAFAKAGRGLVVAGDTGDPNDLFRRTLRTNGWHSIDLHLFAIRVDDLTIVPLGARTQPEGASQAGQIATERLVTPLDFLVLAQKTPLDGRDASLAPMSPAAAVATLIGVSLDFQVERKRAMKWLCEVVERRPATQLCFSRPDEAAQVLAHWLQDSGEVAAK